MTWSISIFALYNDNIFIRGHDVTEKLTDHNETRCVICNVVAVMISKTSYHMH